MVPVVSLMVLWALATVSTVQSAWTLRQFKELDANLAGPVGELVSSLQSERAAVARHLARPGGSGQRPALERQQARTDAATRALRNGVGLTSADIATLAPEVNQRIENVNRDLTRLRSDRAAVAAGRQNWQHAYEGYTAAIEDAFAVHAALTNIQDGPPAQAVLPLERLGEMLARQDTVLISARASGQLTTEQYRTFTGALGGQHTIGTGLRHELGTTERTAYQRLLDGDAYRSLSSLQNTVLDVDARGAVTTATFADQWEAAMEGVTRDLGAIQDSASAAASVHADEASDSALAQGAATVILGLLAVLLALLISVQIGRGLVVELVRLRDAALELARRRLPQAMRRLRAGEKIDVDADVPVMPPGDGEIGQVGDALNAVQYSALQAAAERAELLTGVSGVFVTLARRSQSLMHRQLSLLDAMERRTENPDDLEDLFRLDHLAARMRRHAEGLIIMSGAAPGRAWSEPVPLMNVIRAAVAEVEDFHRVEIRRMADVSVQGAAVADLTHMIAELVENAASFSPPNTIVLVHGEPVGAGFVVEIEDRGLGMRPESMAEANRRIAEAHQLDLFDRDQLGFFVVSRLANRQNVSVTLRPSAYGGTTAVLLLPTSILMPFVPLAPSAGDGRQVAKTATVPPAPRQRDTVSGSLPWPEHDPQPAPPSRQPPANAVHTAEPPAPAEKPADTPGDDAGGLPRRKRQANLAPGLRSPGDGVGDDGASAGATPAQASPEQARATMSALQQGFSRGRDG